MAIVELIKRHSLFPGFLEFQTLIRGSDYVGSLPLFPSSMYFLLMTLHKYVCNFLFLMRHSNCSLLGVLILCADEELIADSANCFRLLHNCRVMQTCPIGRG